MIMLRNVGLIIRNNNLNEHEDHLWLGECKSSE